MNTTKTRNKKYSWPRLKKAWGLRIVPPDLSSEVYCCLCGTSEGLTTDVKTEFVTPKRGRALLSQIQKRAWCRPCSVFYFGGNNV